MKIDPTQFNSIKNIKKKSRIEIPIDEPKVTEKKLFNVSADSMLVQKGLDALKTYGSMNAEKLKGIKQAVDSGTYEINYDKLAEIVEGIL